MIMANVKYFVIPLISVVIPVKAGIQSIKSGFRIKCGMTGR